MSVHAISQADRLPLNTVGSTGTNQATPVLEEIFALLQQIQTHMLLKGIDFSTVVREELEASKQANAELTSEYRQHGWSLASLACAGGVLMGLSTAMSSIHGLDPTFATLIDSLGGMKKAEEFCQIGSKLAENITPVTNTWSQGKVAGLHNDEQVYQIARQQGERADRESGDAVRHCVEAGLRILDMHGRAFA